MRTTTFPARVLLMKQTGGMSMISRRDLIVATAAGAAMTATAANAASYGNPDEPPQGAINAKNPGSVAAPGPQNPNLASQFPSAFSPPPTDVGDLPMFWASFNNAPRRIQNGGGAGEGTHTGFSVRGGVSGG